MSAEFTKVSRTLFRKSKKFRSLDDHARLLYLYLLVSEHINSAGCYQLSEGYALSDLRWDTDRFHEGMDTLCKASLISWNRETETVLIEGWVQFNEPANARHAIGILTQLDEVDDEVLKQRRFIEVKASIESKKLTNERQVGADLSALLRRFAYPIETVFPPKTETQTEKEKKNKTEIEIKTETQDCECATPPPAAAPPDGGGLAASMELAASFHTAAADRTPTPTRLLSTAYMQHPTRQDEPGDMPDFLNRRKGRAA